ncbi:hypothetical protein [Halpernia frigidisoli]|uniref:Lipoprotein n=1 Tax=Halpernia frigidisoli TaxID=1125876 RepID=A0A1I3DGH6_9FLAO|nr:hypothetical protein [Halpernia frigidisoli]SFH85882.1 hypothetical protein SAMN05443292_0451 [Halpernia frigidisoli]
MKFLSNLFLIAAFSVSILSCKSISTNQFHSATIVKDCSGTYLRTAEKVDYLVCNSELLKDKKEGEKVSVNFKMTTECPERNGEIRCMLYHENKGLVRISSFK